MEKTVEIKIENGITIEHVRLLCPRCKSKSIRHYSLRKKKDKDIRYYNCRTCYLNFKTVEFVCS